MLLRVAILAALVLVVIGYASKSGLPEALVRLASDAAEPAPEETARSGPVVLAANSDGHYFVDGVVSGRPVSFVVDTGATSVVLSAETARRLNISPAPRDFTGVSRTANGSVPFAPVRLAEVRIGSIMMRNVEAVVLPEGALDMNLLGMTFLSRLRSFQSTGRQMVLTP